MREFRLLIQFDDVDVPPLLPSPLSTILQGHRCCIRGLALPRAVVIGLKKYKTSQCVFFSPPIPEQINVVQPDHTGIPQVQQCKTMRKQTIYVETVRFADSVAFKYSCLDHIQLSIYLSIYYTSLKPKHTVYCIDQDTTTTTQCLPVMKCYKTKCVFMCLLGLELLRI